MKSNKDELESPEVPDLRLVEFKWRKQKFYLTVLLLAIPLLLLMWFLFTIGMQSFVSDRRDVEYLNYELSRIYDRENEIMQKIDELEIRQDNLDSHSSTLRGNLEANRSIIQILRQDIEKLKEE